MAYAAMAYIVMAGRRLGLRRTELAGYILAPARRLLPPTVRSDMSIDMHAGMRVEKKNRAPLTSAVS